MMKTAGHEVTRLKRVAFGGIELGGLAPGKWRAVTREEIRAAFPALATIFVLVRTISIPDEFFFAHRGVGLWISLVASLALIGAGLLQASEEL